MFIYRHNKSQTEDFVFRLQKYLSRNLSNNNHRNNGSRTLSLERLNLQVMHAAFIVAGTQLILPYEFIKKCAWNGSSNVKPKSPSRRISMVSHRVPISIRRDNLNITPEKICFTLHASIRICPEYTVILFRLVRYFSSVVHRKICYLLITVHVSHLKIIVI